MTYWPALPHVQKNLLFVKTYVHTLKISQLKKQSVNQLQTRWTFLYPLRRLWYVSSVQPVETITCGDAKILNQHVLWLMRLGAIHIWCLAMIFIFTTSQLFKQHQWDLTSFMCFLITSYVLAHSEHHILLWHRNFATVAQTTTAPLHATNVITTRTSSCWLGAKRSFQGQTTSFQLFKILALLPM